MGMEIDIEKVGLVQNLCLQSRSCLVAPVSKNKSLTGSRLNRLHFALWALLCIIAPRCSKTLRKMIISKCNLHGNVAPMVRPFLELAVL